MNLIYLNWPIIGMALWTWAIIAVATLITPRCSRPELFFAVTVNPSFRQSAAGRVILRRYYASVVVVSLVALPLVALVMFRSPALKIGGLLAPVFVEMAGWFGAFIVARRRTMPHHVEPSGEREAQLQPRQVSLPGSWLGQLGPFLILGVVCLGLGLRWDSMPAQIPIHWSAGGRPNAWAAKSPATVFGSAMTGVLLCLMIAGLSYAVIKGVRRIHSSGPRARGEAQFIRVMSLFLLGTEYWLALLMGLLSLAALRKTPGAPLAVFWPALLGQTLFIAAIFVIAFRVGQGGSRQGLAEERGSLDLDTPPVGDRTPDECWKLGLFYFNRNDPALFVEKRFGVGWTLNFANPRSWLVSGALLFVILAIPGLALLMTKGGHSVGRMH